MDISRSSHKRIIQVIVFIIALAIIFGLEWLALTPEGQRTIKSLDSLSYITVNDLDQVTFSKSITVSGTADLPGYIELTGSAQSERRSFAGLNNAFVFSNVGLREGWNSLTLHPVASLVGLEIPLNDEMKSVWVATSHPPTPTLAAMPTTVNQPRLIVNGEAELGSRVVVTTVNAAAPQNHQVDQTTYGTFDGNNYLSTGSGRFHKVVVLQQPGTYSLTVQSRNTAGYSSPPTQPVTVTYDPAWTPKTISPSTRIVTATVEFKRIHYDIAITLPNSDPRLAALTAGQLLFSEFLTDEFGGLGTNQAPIEWEYYGVGPQFERSNDTTTILASSQVRSFEYYELPLWSGDFRLGNLQDFPVNADDHLVLVVHDYAIKSLSVTPSNRSDQTVVWSGDRDDIDPMNGINVSISLASNVSSILPLLARLEPDDLIPSASSVTGTIAGLYIVLPMIWVLGLLYKNRESNGLDERIAQSFARLTRLLIIVALTGFVYSSPDFVETDPGSRYLPLVGLAIGALITHLIARKRGEGTLDFWRQTLFFGLRDAFLISLAIDALILVPVVLPVLATWRYQILAALVVAPFILMALWVGLPFFSAWFEPLSKWKIPILVLGMALGFPILLVSYDLTRYATDFYSGQYDTLSLYVSSFLWLVRNAALPVFLLGIILLLRQAPPQGKLSRPVVFGIGTVIFTLYLVGTSLLWLDIPIAFLLSLWIFPNLVLRPTEQQRMVDSLTPQIMAERPKFLTLALSVAESISFAEALDRLENKVVSGDLTPEEFEQRKQGIEAYVTQHERENTLANGVKARDAVFDIGPLANNWENGVWATKVGLVLSFPIFLVYAPNLFQESPYLALSVLITLSTFFSKWLAAAFFFGYYFPYIRGATGLKKGLTLAFAMLGALLPAWLITQPEPLVIFFHLAEILMFFAVLGILAFDYRVFRTSLPGRLRWRKFLLLEGIPGVTAFTSILVASLGVAVNSILTGQFTTILGAIVASSFPQLQQWQQLLSQFAERSQNLPK